MSACGPNSQFGKKFNIPFKHNTPLIKENINVELINNKDIFGNSPLLLSTQKNYNQITNLLLDLNCDIDLPNNKQTHSHMCEIHCNNSGVIRN